MYSLPRRALRQLLSCVLLAGCAVHAWAVQAEQPLAGQAGTTQTAPADGASDIAAPSAEECKHYPPGVQVTSVRRIEFREIAAAQAAEAAQAAAGNAGGKGTPAQAPQPAAGPNSRQGRGSSAIDAKPAVLDIAELRHGLSVDVAELPRLMRLRECAGKPRALVLFLAGRPMPGLTAYPPTDPAHDKIIFLLERSQDNADAWTYLLGKPSLGTTPLNVSVGFDDSYPIPSSSQVAFRAIPAGWSVAWLCVMFVFGFVLLWAARRTGMLRDNGVVAGAKPAMFSLARVQLAFWTFIVIGSFIFIGMITGDYLSSMKEHVLGLMGISVGTALGSSIIDNGASGTATRAALPSTGSWWRDILNDGKDISIHRFQMAAWTIVLGIIFLHQVYGTLSMPEFPATLLGLMGISAGTYLGLKVTLETPPASPAAGAQPGQGGPVNPAPAGAAGKQPGGAPVGNPPGDGAAVQ